MRKDGVFEVVVHVEVVPGSIATRRRSQVGR
jgi:hypothetical protein